MMIKANGEYLDFDGEITLEKQIKLFEDISTADGDFSYQFEIPKTINNTRILAAPFPDNIIKQTYIRIPAEILSDDGLSVGIGYLRIEGITSVYECSFFSGNNNWFAEISGSLKDIDMSEFEEDLTATNVINSWARTEGVKYPLVDPGDLSGRTIDIFMLLDFIPFIFVKTIIEKIFASSGITIQGEILLEPRYQKLMIATNPDSSQEITNRSTNAEKDPQGPLLAYALLTFPNDSVLPFFDGSQNNYDASLSRYTADIEMIVTIEFTLNFDDAILVAWQIRINGVQTTDGTFDGAQVCNEDRPLQVIKNNVHLYAGDEVEIWAGSVLVSSSVISGFLKVTPVILFKTFSDQLMPNWTKQKFVSNVLKLFNAITNYDSGSKTLTINLFENIKSKDSVDLSEHVEDPEVDFVEFISDYAKQNVAKYKVPSIEDIDKYNDSALLFYGNGAVLSSNEFLKPTEDFIDSDFSSPFDYVNDVFTTSLAKLNFNELSEGDTIDVTQVNDDGGFAEIEVPVGHGLVVGDLVRIKESTVIQYNGDTVVSAVTSTTIHLYNMTYNGDANLTLNKLNISRSGSDDVFIALDSDALTMTEFSDKPYVLISHDQTITGSSGDHPSIAFFSMLNIGKPVNTLMKQGLSWGPSNNTLFYQQTLLESYYRLFETMLNDPVKIKANAYIPYATFLSIDFLSPIDIKTIVTSNQYYLNRVTGYKGSQFPCTVELIKI